MEEKPSFIKGLVKDLGWIILVDTLVIAAVGLYIWIGVRGSAYEFGEKLISIGGFVSIIGFFISRLPFSSSTASGVYRIGNPDQSDMREKRMKKYFAEQKKVATGRLTFIIVGISIFLIGIGIQGFYYQPSGPVREPSLEVEVLSAKEMYPEAHGLASLWSENAKLNEVWLRMIGPDDILKINNVFFHFISNEFPNEYLTVSCSYSNCESTVFDSTDSDVTFMEFDEVKIDSIEAAHIGLANGGEKYMRGERGSGDLHLRWSKEHTLEWVLYFHCHEYGRMYVYIDPYTGEVIDKGN
jgi:hypothetical protein